MKNAQAVGRTEQGRPEDRRARTVLSLRPSSVLLAGLFLAAGAVNGVLFLVLVVTKFDNLLLGRGSPAQYLGVVLYGLGAFAAVVGAVGTLDRARKRRG